MRRHLIVMLAALFAAAPASAADRISKESFGSGGATRTYYLYVPEAVKDTPVPLLVVLHGSGRNGLSQVERWKDLAKKEGIIVAGPDATKSEAWNMAVDGPDFLHDLVEVISAGHPVNPRRVYLFGHSAGAIHGLMIGLLESGYFAAAAVHAGALPPDTYDYGTRAIRKIPLAIWVGTNDSFFPLAAVRATRDALVRQGIDVRLTEISGHTHDYYGRAGEINRAAWTFLSPVTLDAGVHEGSDSAVTRSVVTVPR
jgi:poly(3-hydroxybutyrate) depolymerase